MGIKHKEFVHISQDELTDLEKDTPKCKYCNVPQGEEQIDFNILVSFGKKILDSEVRIDEDIQQFINDNFWDML